MGTRTGAGMGRERERGWRPVDAHRMGTGSGDENEISNEDGNEDEDGNVNRDEDRIGEGGRAVKERKHPRKSCRRHMGNEGDLGGKSKKHRKERVGPVAAYPDNLEKSKKSGGGAQDTQDSSKNCTYK